MAERRRRRHRGVTGAPGSGEPARSGRVFGLHACRAVVERRPESIRTGWLLASAAHGALMELAGAIERGGVALTRVPRGKLDALADGGAHQGIILEIQSVKPLSLADFEELVLARGAAVRLLLLDRIEDPRNLGACLRTAAAAGVDAVVVPRDRCAPLSAAAVKAAAGASEVVPLVRVTNLARTMRLLRAGGVRIAGAVPDAPVPLYEAQIEPPIALVLGAEGAGLRRLTRENCDELFSIPMPGPIESLNVAVATGIVLFESLRRGGTGTAGGA